MSQQSSGSDSREDEKKFVPLSLCLQYLEGCRDNLLRRWVKSKVESIPFGRIKEPKNILCLRFTLCELHNASKSRRNWREQPSMSINKIHSKPD